MTDNKGTDHYGRFLNEMNPNNCTVIVCLHWYNWTYLS